MSVFSPAPKDIRVGAETSDPASGISFDRFARPDMERLGVKVVVPTRRC